MNILLRERNTQLKDKIRDAEESMQKLQQQQQQSQMQMEQDKLKTEQMKMENENVQNDKDRDNKLDIAELNNETALDIARMKSDTDSKQIDSSIETATMKDRTDKDKVRESRESTVSKERTDTMNMISEERKASADRESNEKIAKEKPTNTTEK